MTSIVRNWFELTAHQRPTVGDMKTSAIGIDHMGWLVCDGRALLISEFPQLYNVIGRSFGSNSSSDFLLPNPAGRVPGFIGSGAGLTSRSLGSNVGAETHTLTIAEMPTHNHGVTDPGHAHTQTTINDDFNNSGNYGGNYEKPSYPNQDGSGSITWTSTINSNVTGITIQNQGGSNAHNNMQPTLFVGNMFIYSGRPFYGSNAITPTAPYTAGIYVQSVANPGSNLA